MVIVYPCLPAFFTLISAKHVLSISAVIAPGISNAIRQSTTVGSPAFPCDLAAALLTLHAIHQRLVRRVVLVLGSRWKDG